MATDYTKLITSQHSDKPKFVAMVGLITGIVGDVSDSIQGMTNDFDLDQAVGPQLDAVGLWVGTNRQVLIPIANAWFSFDIDGLGWDEANWQGPYDPTEGITSLDDGTFRAVIKAKIAANYWDGTNESLQQIAADTFVAENIKILVTDDLNMTMDDLYLTGAGLTAVLQALFKRGIFPPKPVGVRVNGYFMNSNPSSPFFGLDTDTADVAGLDVGAWSVSL